MNYGYTPHNTLSNLHLQRLIDVGRGLTSNLDLDSLLRQIVDAARDLTGARYAALGILNDQRTELDQFITTGVDEKLRAMIGELPRGRGVLGVLIDKPVPLRLRRVSDHEASFGFPEHHPPMQSFLGVPITIDGKAFGNLYLTDKNVGEFDEDDEAAVLTLATWAAIAIENARSVREDRLRSAIDAAEQERRRWARELHDETLQSLGGLNVLLASALRLKDPDILANAAREAVDRLQVEISNLRALITELRPAALDEIGLAAALESLADRTTATNDVKLEVDLKLEINDRLPRERETAVYRIVQEAVHNAIKHSRAPHVWIRVEQSQSGVDLIVRDDGEGFNPENVTGGFGMLGMRERVELTGGEFDVLSEAGSGTTVTASMPLGNGLHGTRVD